MHNLSNKSKFKILYPQKNLQFSMNTVGPYGPSGGERVNLYSRSISSFHLQSVFLHASIEMHASLDLFCMENVGFPLTPSSGGSFAF